MDRDGQARTATALSLPTEHGGYLSVVAATLAAAAAAGAPTYAAAGGGALLLAFLARGPVDRLAMRLPLRRLDLALLLLSLGGAGALAETLALRQPLPARALEAMCVLLLGASAFAKRQGIKREQLFELAAMTLLGASAGLLLWLGGATPHKSAVLALGMAVHTGASVPLVHTLVRSSARALAPRARRDTAVVLAAAALALLLMADPAALLLLAPRAAHLVALTVWRPTPMRAATAGLIETVLLLAMVAAAYLSLAA